MDVDQPTNAAESSSTSTAQGEGEGEEASTAMSIESESSPPDTEADADAEAEADAETDAEVQQSTPSTTTTSTSITTASSITTSPSAATDAAKNINTNTNGQSTPPSSTTTANTSSASVSVSVNANANTNNTNKSSSKKRSRENVTPAALTSALQAIHTSFATTFPTHYHGAFQLPSFQALVHSYLTSKSANANASANLPNYILNHIQAQIITGASKSLNDIPPHVHLSPKDAAPQLVLEHTSRDPALNDKLTVLGGMRGYRMVRASQGVEMGCWYYEALVMDPPPVKDVVKALPNNVRLGDGVREGLRRGLEKEQREEELKLAMGNENENSSNNTNTGEETKKKKRKIDPSSKNGVEQYGVGGHLRMGWSMRTGELQAPVGYDRWSYGIRDVSGSRIHNSKREDKWGGEGFGPGDVVGFAVCLVGKEKENTDMGMMSGGGGGGNNGSGAPPLNHPNSKRNHTASNVSSNHIRFFKNGNPMGHFIVSRGVKSGGEAFDRIKAGTYYPAISSYMGGSARVNFGPHFICPPRGLPTGMKLRPLSDVCPDPMAPQDVLDAFVKEKLLGKKLEGEAGLVEAIHKAVLTEATMRHDAFLKHRSDHVEEVRKGRMDRGAGTSDLPPPKPEPVVEAEADVEQPEPETKTESAPVEKGSMGNDVKMGEGSSNIAKEVSTSAMNT
uniref:SPRY domain-containing protein n=1 Tax=Chaetoceros debilis TaxID=122233 RepID=A0A7S3VAV2_9STRA|mmetsp:Transcript_42/g.92  ORF Transcript_42/g.92 Transcript_42/m.92 type:complete len:676 (+) Transcript_42:89-2116(+)